MVVPMGTIGIGAQPKGGPAETPGKEQGKGCKNSAANISPHESLASDQQKVGDGVAEALRR